MTTLTLPLTQSEALPMPNRDIKESCRTSDSLAQLSHGAERLFWRLTTVADDFGRFEARASVLRASCFPVLLDRVREADVKRWTEELVKAGMVGLYLSDGKPLGFFTNWSKHQRTRAKNSKWPEPPADICQHMTADSAVVTEETVVTEDTVKTDSRSSTSGQAGAVEWGRPEQLIDLYNRLAPQGLARVTRLSPGRRTKARKYLAAFPEREFWVRCFTELRFSRFLQGLASSPGHESFRGDLDWLLTKGRDGSENAVKTAEGKFRDKEHAG